MNGQKLTTTEVFISSDCNDGYLTWHTYNICLQSAPSFTPHTTVSVGLYALELRGSFPCLFFKESGSATFRIDEMNAAMSFTFVLSLLSIPFWRCIHADAGFGDLSGTFTLEPELGGLKFCTKDLRVDAIGNEVTGLKFDGNETVCSIGNLMFGQRKWSPLNSTRSNAMGISLWLINGDANCDRKTVQFLYHRPLKTISIDMLGFEENVTFRRQELYLSIWQPRVSSCIYKSDKPALVPAPISVEGEAEGKVESQEQTVTTVWDWLGPLFALIITLITAAFVTCRSCCGQKLTHT